MELSQLMQKSVFKILSIETPLKFLWILGIFEQNQLSKKKTLQNGSSWRKILVCNSASCGEATLHARIFDLEHFCDRDFFFDKILNFFRISDYNQRVGNLTTFLPISWLSMSYFQREIVLTCCKSNFRQYRWLFGKGLPFLCKKIEKMQKIRPKFPSP